MKTALATDEPERPKSGATTGNISMGVTVVNIPKKLNRTDIIKGVIERELEAHRDQLDRDTGLRSLTITVKMNQSNGTPRAVILHRESERPLS